MGTTARENAATHRAWREWLATQQHRDDPVGDFARDYLRDECAAGIRTLSGVDRHLIHEHDASAAVLAARDRAWREYSAAQAAPGAP